MNVLCYVSSDRVNIPLWYKLYITTNHGQAYNRHPQISTNHQQLSTGQESQTCYPYMQSADRLSQHSIPKSLYKRGCKSPEQLTSCGNQKNPTQKISRANTSTLQEARQGIRHEAQDCSSQLGTNSN